jgi:hypothetical protein
MLRERMSLCFVMADMSSMVEMAGAPMVTPFRHFGVWEADRAGNEKLRRGLTETVSPGVRSATSAPE